MLVSANAVVALGYGVVAPVLPQYARQLRRQHQRRDVRHHRVRGDAAGRRTAGRAAGAAAGGAADLHHRPADRGAVDRGVRVRADLLAAAVVPVAGRLRLGDVHGVVAGPDDPDLAAGCTRPGGGAVLVGVPGRVGGRPGARQPHRRVWGCPRRSSSTASALLVAAAVVFFSLRHSPIGAPEVQHRAGGVGAARCCATAAYRAALFSNFATGWSAFGLRIALVPLFVVEVLGRGAGMAGLALATFAIGNVSAVIPSGYLSDRVGRRLLLIVGLTVSAVATVLVGFTSSLPVFLAAAYVTGAATGMFISPQQAAVADIVGSKARGGTAVATFQMMSDFGAILGSLAVGLDRPAPVVRRRRS